MSIRRRKKLPYEDTCTMSGSIDSHEVLYASVFMPGYTILGVIFSEEKLTIVTRAVNLELARITSACPAWNLSAHFDGTKNNSKYLSSLLRTSPWDTDISASANQRSSAVSSPPHIRHSPAACLGNDSRRPRVCRPKPVGRVCMLRVGPQRRHHILQHMSSEETWSSAAVVHVPIGCGTSPSMSEETVGRCGAHAVCLPMYHSD